MFNGRGDLARSFVVRSNLNCQRALAHGWEAHFNVKILGNVLRKP